MTISRVRWLQVALLCLALSAPFPLSVSAWGEYGHEIVANLAWGRLSFATQRRITAVLNITNATLIEETGSPLAAVANWADNVRHFLPWSAALHYIDIRDDSIVGGCHYKDATTANESPATPCAFQYDRDCPFDECVAGAIVNYSTQLLQFVEEQSLPRLSRLRKQSTRYQNPDVRTEQALKFLIHFLGDIHQPLHASRTSDKGGNDISVKYHLLPSNRHHFRHSVDEAHFQKNGQRSISHHHPHHHTWNLHSIWDTALIETSLERSYDNNRTSMEKDLQAMLDQHPKWIKDYAACPALIDNTGGDIHAPPTGLNITCVIHWGQESWERALKYAYTRNEPWKPSEIEPPVDVVSGDEIDEEYYKSRIEIVNKQLIAGGVRLAWTLEEIFGGRKSNVNPLSITDANSSLSLWGTMSMS